MTKEEMLAKQDADFAELKEEDFPITPVIINHDNKFSKKLGHRDYLGSLTGLGIDRRKLGDIVVFDDFAIVFVHRAIADYIAANLEYVGRTKVYSDVYKSIYLFTRKFLISNHPYTSVSKPFSLSHFTDFLSASIVFVSSTHLAFLILARLSLS